MPRSPEFNPQASADGVRVFDQTGTMLIFIPANDGVHSASILAELANSPGSLNSLGIVMQGLNGLAKPEGIQPEIIPPKLIPAWAHFGEPRLSSDFDTLVQFLDLNPLQTAAMYAHAGVSSLEKWYQAASKNDVRPYFSEIRRHALDDILLFLSDLVDASQTYGLINGVKEYGLSDSLNNIAEALEVSGVFDNPYATLRRPHSSLITADIVENLVCADPDVRNSAQLMQFLYGRNKKERPSWTSSENTKRTRRISDLGARVALVDITTHKGNDDLKLDFPTSCCVFLFGFFNQQLDRHADHLSPPPFLRQSLGVNGQI